jgi:hypothetical protein
LEIIVIRFGAAIAAAALMTCAASQASAAYQQYDAYLTPGAVVPPNASSGSGSVHLGFDTDSGELDYTVDFKGLSGAPTGGGFHGPAAKTAEGPLMISTPLSASSASGSIKLTPQQSSALNAGLWYFSIETAANPKGEVRGQLRRSQ